MPLIFAFGFAQVAISIKVFVQNRTKLFNSFLFFTVINVNWVSNHREWLIWPSLYESFCLWFWV